MKTNTITAKSFAEAAAIMFPEMGKKRPPQAEWLKKQQDKFLKCPKCGGTLTHPVGTNVLMCENTVEDKDKKTVPCGFTRYLDEGGQNFSTFLFGTKPEAKAVTA